MANPVSDPEPIDKIEFVVVYEDEQGNRVERPLSDAAHGLPNERSLPRDGSVRRHDLDGNL